MQAEIPIEDIRVAWDLLLADIFWPCRRDMPIISG